MSSESIIIGEQSRVFLERMRVNAAKLHKADRIARRHVRALERALLRVHPGVPLWTEPFHSDQAPMSHAGDGTSESGPRSESGTRTVSLGFARVTLLPVVNRVLRAAKIPHGIDVWGLVVCERLQGGGRKKVVTERVTLLRRADRDLRLLALAQLDALVRLVHDELDARVNALPPPLARAVRGAPEAPAKAAPVNGDGLASTQLAAQSA
jgi:hypothetical protein